MNSTVEDLEQVLEHELNRADNFGRLIEKQSALLESGELQDLPRVLERKDRIIARLLELRQRFETVQGAASGLSPRTLELWEELQRRMTRYGEIDRACLERSIELRQETARRLRRLKNGKKMLHGYKRPPSGGKARFKDIKT